MDKEGRGFNKRGVPFLVGGIGEVRDERRGEDFV